MKHRKLIFFLVLASILTVGLAIYLIVDAAFTWHALKETKWQDFGSYLGGIATNILSIATTSILIVAFLMQKNQLEVQQAELRLNTEELRLNREESQKQSDIWETQKFESNFLSMLANIQRIVPTLNNGNLNGRRLLNACADALKNHHMSLTDAFRTVGVLYSSIFIVLKYVDDTAIEIDKKFYIMMVVSQLADSEIDILNCFLTDSSFAPYYKDHLRRILQKHLDYQGGDLNLHIFR